jgi:hypothetical protein
MNDTADQRLYRITPLQKKSVEYFVDVFERLPDGTVRGFDVTEVWRWGYGFRELDEPVWKYEADSVNCRPEVGWGCELDDLCAVYVNFSEGFTDKEKEKIEAILCGEKEDDDGRWGTTWLYDGDHNWEIEDDHVRILGPVKIDLVDANGYGDDAVIEENVEPYDE